MLCLEKNSVHFFQYNQFRNFRKIGQYSNDCSEDSNHHRYNNFYLKKTDRKKGRDFTTKMLKTNFSGHIKQLYSHQINFYLIDSLVSVVRLDLFVPSTIPILLAKKSKLMKLHWENVKTWTDSFVRKSFNSLAE